MVSVVNRLHDETVRALLVPRTRARLSTLGVVPMQMTPDQFDARIRDEIATNVRRIGANAPAAGPPQTPDLTGDQ
jgi:hypothetical protein